MQNNVGPVVRVVEDVGRERGSRAVDVNAGDAGKRGDNTSGVVVVGVG